MGDRHRRRPHHHRPHRRVPRQGPVPAVPKAEPALGRAMASPVDWRFAERVALRFSGSEPFAQSYHAESLEPDFAELTAQAEELVAATTGLRSQAGPARARVVDRAAWIRANLASFQRLLQPLLAKVDV